MQHSTATRTISRNHTRSTGTSRKYTKYTLSVIVSLSLMVLGITFTLFVPRRQNAYSQNAPAYLYYALKDAQGFVLARALKGANGQPLGMPQQLIRFGDEFGQVESDSIATMQLSPDGRYLAIDGIRDHGEQVWVYDTQQNTLTLQPSAVMGNFLHWLAGGNGHTFLYRPMFPLGPQAPLDGGTWNPGLWLVDAATGIHRNIDIHMPSAFLVDAASSPDGSRIIYSTSTGLGMGSDVWLMQSNGTQVTHLFTSNTQSVIGLFGWSPDGKQIVYEELANSEIPFLPAKLWVMNSQGGQQHLLASVDGGHGYAPVWSPDSGKIAFVVRTNVTDAQADELSQSLQCAISIVNVQSGQIWQIASSRETGMQININPVWAANSASITFTALNPINQVIGGSPRYWLASIAQTSIKPISPTLSHIAAIG